MGFLKIVDHVEHCYTNADGDVIKKLIDRMLSEGQVVQVSFEGVNSVSSSFLNSALIELLEKYTFQQIKESVSFIKSNRSINEAIKMRFSFEVNERKKLISV